MNLIPSSVFSIISKSACMTAHHTNGMPQKYAITPVEKWRREKLSMVAIPIYCGVGC